MRFLVFWWVEKLSGRKKKVAENIPSTNITTAAPMLHILHTAPRKPPKLWTQMIAILVKVLYIKLQKSFWICHFDENSLVLSDENLQSSVPRPIWS